MAEMTGHPVQGKGHSDIQQNIEGNNQSDMVSNQRQLQPGGQIIQESKAGAAYRKYKLKKGLLPITGPQIQIIHVKSPDLHPLIDPKAKTYQYK